MTVFIMRQLCALLVLDPRFRKFRYRLAIFLYAMVLVFGSVPGARMEVGAFASGLVLHSITYAVLAALLYTGSEGSPGARAWKSVLTVMAMGFVDELIQSFLPYRTGAWQDWMVDCVAGLLSATLLWALLPNQAQTTRAVNDIR